MKRLEYPNIPFHALLQRAADTWPEKVAIHFGDNEITFREWNDAASQLANGLRDLAIEPGDRIGLFTPNCPEYEIAFFGVTRAGAAPTPLNPAYKEREILHQLNDSRASAVVVHESLYPRLAAVRHHLPALHSVIVIGDTTDHGAISFQHLVSSHPAAVPDIALDRDVLASLPYSSGTTGASKGVMLTQRNMVCNAVQFADATATSTSDSMLLFLPLYHIYGVALMATAVAGGARQILMERFDMEKMLDLTERHHVTELFVVPPVMLALLNVPDVPGTALASLRFLKSAAAPLAPEIARRIAGRFNVRVIQAYGMTEASPLTHMVPLTENGFDNVGVVVADTQCRIVDLETGVHELSPGEVGEVTICGPQVMAGYWNAPDETAYAVRDGWLFTGDVGTVDEHGRLFIVDRKKEMIKYKAFSIAPAELEAVLLEHPGVLDCAVTGQPDEEAGEVPRAYVVLRTDTTATPEELQKFVAERVAGYKQIRAIEVTPSIPRTPSGKILRRLLRAENSTPT